VSKSAALFFQSGVGYILRTSPEGIKVADCQGYFLISCAAFFFFQVSLIKKAVLYTMPKKKLA